MKVNLKINFIEFLFLLFPFAVMTACNDNNENLDTSNDEDNAELVFRKLQRRALLESLCHVDSLPDGTLTYTSRYGTVLDEVMPTTYYMGIDDVSQARDTWNGIISVFNESESEVYDKDEVHLENMDLHFSVSDNGDEMARIEVDCPELKNILTSIVFIPSAKFPDNDKGSPFLFMSFWEKDEHVYLCVRKAQGSRGIMLCFDHGWKEDWFIKYDHWQGEFYLWMYTADAEAFNCLSSIMQYNSDKYTEALKALEKRKGSGTMFHTLNYSLSHSYNITFDRHYTYDHHLWWAYNCYDVRLHKTTFYWDKSCCHWSKYYTHTETPERSHASHAFYFDQNFSKEGWTCIFRGIS